MEKGCSAASSNRQSAQDAQQELSELKPKKKTPQGPQPKSKSKSKPQPSTSQVRFEEATRTVQVTESMSKLREDVADVDVDCVSSNSQHGGFAVVLDDESSTETGVLETFEISSSNSLPTHSTGTAASVEVSTVHSVVVVPVDDSSSTDTLNGNENGGNSEDHSVSASSMNNVFFNDNDNDNEPPVVCLINDDDDFDEEDIVEEEEEDNEDEDDDEEVQQQQQQQQSMPIDCPNTSQIDGGIITTADGSKIFLETPVVEEPQSHPINHHHHHPNIATAANVAQSDGMLTGKPKRLSDEFDAQDPDPEQEQEEATRGVKSESDAGQGDVASTSLHDRQMSVRLKQMSLTANSTSNSTEAMPPSSGQAHHSTLSHSHSHSLSKADIESMDRIERRDFETEQRLTGGIVLGTSKLISKNRLNLSLINAGGAAGAAGGSASGSSSSDDWPSSSNGRAFSSDSKCTYKDLSTTPTSSRKYTNSRLSKSTAKLNLGSTLGTSNTSGAAGGGGGGAGGPQHSASTNFLKSSVIVEPSGSSSSSSSSNASTSTSSSTSTLNTNRADVYTNTNSNDNLNASAADKDSSSSDKDNCTPVATSTSASTSTSFSSVGSQTTSQEGGCSRTSVVPCAASHLDVDAQPSTSATSSSTSSARCHYAGAATSKVATRQVTNASAQTQERFLARSGLAAGGAVNNNNRSRRRVEATRNGSKDVIVLEVVVEENANNANGEGGAHVEPGDFSADEPWGNCDGDEENNCSDLEEICTCQNSMMANSRSGSNGSLSEGLDMDATDGYHHIQGTAGEESLGISSSLYCSQQQQQQQQRKRKYNEGRLLDGDYSMSITGSGGAAAAGGAGGVAAGDTGDNSRKRIAYDFASTPRSSSSSSPPPG
ncbi:hypothetical protein ACLKA6_015775 [Drosophila palustris]